MSKRFAAAVFSFFFVPLAACGGGGVSQATGSTVVPAVNGTPAPGISIMSGPVTYLQSSGPLSSAGNIVAGTQRALVAVMSSATTSSGFADDSLTVASSSVTAQSESAFQTAARAAVPSRIGAVEAFAADDRALLMRRSALATGQISSPAVRTQSVLPSALQAGSTASLWVQQGSLSSTARTNVKVPSTLLLQSAHANVWIDNSLLAGASASPSFAPGSLSSTLAHIATDFENAYASDVAHFASPDYGSGAPGLQPQYKSCSPTGASQGTTRGYIGEPPDGRINVMVVNTQNLGGIGGYFSGANYIPQSALNCLNGSKTTYESNEAPFIFVGWSQRNGETYELKEDLVRSTAHELQHLINFVHHSILAGGASNPSYNGNELPFINEGLSMLAQDLAVDAMYGNAGVHFDADDALSRAGVFLSDPGKFSIPAFEGIDPVTWGGNNTAQFNCGGGCYGGAYLFQRYMRDRFGGDAYTSAMESGNAIGAQNLQNVTGEAAGTLLDDFALALAAGTLGVNPSEARFAFGSLNVAGTYADQFGSSTTLNGVYATPLAGASVAVQAPIGGFTFVSVPAVPAGGMPLQVTDGASVSGFGMAAGLAQH